MKVLPGEEEILLEAAQQVNQRINERKKRFNTTQNLDLLSTLAFDMSVHSLKEEATHQEMASQLDRINALIDQVLSESL